MKHREISVEGIGGIPLLAQAWLPDGAPSAVIVIAHGLGEHGARYQWLAERLVADGRAVYAIDHRGRRRRLGHRDAGLRIDAAGFRSEIAGRRLRPTS